MQLYKSRNFGDYFQDTFSFLKQNGGHLYKNFFVINGIFILILLVIGYFFSKFYTEILFGSLGGGNPTAVEDYMNENAGMFVIFFLLFITVGLFSAVISYSFVPIYLKLYAKNDSNGFNASDIINEYKAKIGPIFIFLICSILLAIPLFIFAGIISFVLVITIVGFLMLPLVIGAISLFYQNTLMEFIEGKKGIWESFGYSWTLIRSKFWAAIGCVGLFFLMSYIVQNIVVMVPYFIFIFDMMTSIEPGGTVQDPNAVGKSASVMMILIFVLSYLIGMVLNIVVQVNQGVVFYSLKEDMENINTKSDIDLIGTSE